MAATARDLLADRSYRADPIYLTDLDRVTPATALAPDLRPHTWQTLPYETEHLRGVLLWAGFESQSPAVSYPLGRRGWHAISVGFHPTTEDQGWLGQVLVKLSGDDTYSMLRWDPPGGLDGHTRRQRFEELFWRVANLDGQDLVFEQITRRVAAGDGPGAIQGDAAKIAYVKLVPLSDAEAAAHERDRRDAASRRLFGHNDAFYPFTYRTTTAEEIRREVEPYRETDFSRIYWEVGGGDKLYYPTAVGRNPADLELAGYSRLGERLLVESFRELRRNGVDPAEVALRHTHDLGMEFHASYRLAAWTYPPTTMEGYFAGGYFERHPELHCIDREGRVLPRLSYAFPETQEFCLSVLREVAAYPVDGIALLFNRRPPYLDYEAPLVESFKREFGEDPHDLDERDPRWLAHRAAVLTGFMRRLRAEMDAASAARNGRRIGISVCVLGTQADNDFFGLDVATWAREGLIDTLIPYSPAPLALPVAEDTWTSGEQIQPFVEAVRGTRCLMAPNLMPRDLSAEDYRRMASMLYAAGAEHLFVWDCAGSWFRANCQAPWNALRRLGHQDEIEAWRQASEPSLPNPTVPIRRLGGWDMTTIAPG